MPIRVLFTAILLALSFQSVFAENIKCPVNLINGLTLDDEFGAGTAAITRCLVKDDIKVVYQINKFCNDATCTRAYALGNILNAIQDYEITHGMSRRNYRIAAVVHSDGANIILNNDGLPAGSPRNPFETQVKNLIEQGVQFYFCQNTARSKGIKIVDLIPVQRRQRFELRLISSNGKLERSNRSALVTLHAATRPNEPSLNRDG